MSFSAQLLTAAAAAQPVVVEPAEPPPAGAAPLPKPAAPAAPDATSVVPVTAVPEDPAVASKPAEPSLPAPAPASQYLEVEQSADGKPAYEKLTLEQLLQIPVIVTASRQEELATEAPATTLVITREEIRQRGYAFLKDVLRDLPGMETQDYTYSRAGSTQVPVRGVVGNNKILILINGMRINPPGGEPLTLGSNVSVRDAERIEIVYGPGSTLYGQDAISAVLNVITRSKGDENIPISRPDARNRVLGTVPNSRRQFSAGVEFGYPLQKEVWGSLNLRFGEVRLYGSVHFLDKELTDFSKSYPEFWAQQEAAGAGRGLALDPKRFDQGLDVMFRIEHGNTSLQLWHGRSARSSAEGGGTGFVSVSGALWSDSSTVIEARNVLRLGRYFSLESTLGFSYYQLDPSSRILIPSPALPGQPLNFTSNYKYTHGVSGTLSERLTFRLDRRLIVVAGLFVGHYDVTALSTVPGDLDLSRDIASQARAYTYYTRQADPTSLTTIPAVNPLTYQDFGAYLEGNWRIFKLLRLIVGLRIDKNTTVSDLAFSPRAALIFNYKSFTAKYIFARAFVAPSPRVKFDVYRVATILHEPTPGLAPETATSNEFNLSFNHRHFSAGTSIYYNLQDQLIFGNGISGNSVAPIWFDAQGSVAGTLTQTTNGGSSKAIGVDIYVKFNIWKLSGWGSYSYTTFAANVSGNDVASTGYSSHNFRLGLTFSILKNLHVTAGVILKSTPMNVNEQPTWLTAPIELPYELNAHILYSPIPSLDLYADFRNLTDHKYYLGDGAVGTSPYPIQAFQGSGGLRFTF